MAAIGKIARLKFLQKLFRYAGLNPRVGCSGPGVAHQGASARVDVVIVRAMLVDAA